ncbi:hypothetical protein GCM10009648_38180 [Tsukamurella spumae]
MEACALGVRAGAQTTTSDDKRRSYWRTVARRQAAHLAEDTSRDLGIPVDPAAQKILNEEAREIAESA